MKKFITLFVAVIMAISVFAFSACGGSSDKSEKGVIDGNYKEVKEEDMPSLQEKLENVKVPFDADKGTAGGSLTADAEIKLTVGGKALTLTANEAFNLILDITKDFDEDGLSAISGLSAKTKLGVKADEGFGATLIALISNFINEEEVEDLGDDVIDEEEDAESGAMVIAILGLLDNLNLNAELNAYVKDANIYADAKVSGIPDAIKAMIPEEAFDVDALATGVKYVLTEDMIEMLAELIEGRFGYGDYPEYDDGSDIGLQAADIDEDDGPSVSVNEIINVLGGLGVKLYADISGNDVKLKLAATEETKTYIESLIPMLAEADILPDAVKGIIATLDISKLDVELYIAVENGELAEIAADIDVAVAATVAETAVSVSVKTTVNCKVVAPEKISFPSFDGYVSPFPADDELAA
ncbi:MAG: hypothetical protein J6Y43_05280 [Clostridia bacterium]|nr:hypothetical protein [Clostridia bacterium]